MKIKLLAICSALILPLTSLTSCSNSPSFSPICDSLDSLTSSLGGKVVIYRPADSHNIPDSIISLYGRGGTAPDELSLIDFAAIRYSDRLTCADAAVFHAINATDIPSITKMCNRRAQTVKHSLGVDMVIESRSHYVCIYTAGVDEIESVMKSVQG